MVVDAKDGGETHQVLIDYSSSTGLLQRGHEALHGDYAIRVEKALSNGLPQMEIRAKHVSLSVQVVANPNQDDVPSRELPTLANVVKQSLRGFGRRNYEKHVSKTILHDVCGIFKPGTMTLVLGQPGSGKSSLLKALSGQFPLAKHVTIDGTISYNGIDQDSVVKLLPPFVSYVPQRDRHFSTLTVKETLAFAHRCCGADLTPQDEKHFTGGSPTDNATALEAARALYRHYPDIVTDKLGLGHCQDTLIGDALLRGVSGGERKRVTIGEMEFGDKFALFMDEVTTGLDSAAAFDIVKAQRSLAKTLRKTVVMALLQPTPEVFELFDNVLVLNEGYVMYHGPCTQAVGYFESLGFPRAPDSAIADYLMDLGTPQQTKHESRHKTSRPRLPVEFAAIFRESSMFAAIMEELEQPIDDTLEDEMRTRFDSKPSFHLGLWDSVWVLTERELKVTWRNRPYMLGRAAVVIVIGLIYSTLFYDFDPKNVQIVMGTIFPAVLFFSLGQSAHLPLFMEARTIFYKQRAANFFRTSAYVVATALNQVPLAVLESLIFGVLVYWMCGFTVDISSFLIFEFILVVTSLAFSAWFFLLSAASPSIHVAEPLGMLSILFYILFAGFIVVHKNIPVYLEWAYWLNPISWAVRSLAINEYGNERYGGCVFDGIDYCAQYGSTMGVASLKTYDVYTDSAWIWLGAVFMVVSFVVFMSLAGVVLEYCRFDSHDDAGVPAEQLPPTVDGSLDKADMSEYHMVRTPRAITVDVSEAVDQRPFVPVTLTFTELSYSVPHPTDKAQDLELLKNISGFALPGTMTALMGSSGAGKTTLMDVIAGRKTGGKIRGHILLNGHEATDLAIRRCTGYCEQTDIHSEAATIREALTFSAFLRQDACVSESQKHESVEECLDLLDLRPIADKIIRGSSVEQMKRLSIGVELAAQPSVLFLDEPTSGLDARSAKVIMDGVRKVANTGRTVVCTIHQPSWEVFQVFDSLLLLKRGGEMVYFGELGTDAREMVEYFESIDGVPRLPSQSNPATWMLEIIGAGVDTNARQSHDLNFVAEFNSSQKKASMEQKLVASLTPGPVLDFTRKRAASNYVQAKFLILRFWRMYWRSPEYNFTRFIVNIALGVFFGLTFYGTEYTTYQGINAGVGMVFTAAVFVGVVTFTSIPPISIQDRNAFYRERAAQTYNAFWYFVGATLAEIPYVFVNTLVFTAIFLPMIGISGAERYLLFWIHMSVHVLLQAYMGQFLAYALPSLEVATSIGIMVTSIFFLFMGFNPPASQLPSGYKWLYYASPPTYSLAILASVVFGECSSPSDIGCKLLLETPATLPPDITVRQYLSIVFLFERNELWKNFAIVIGCIALFSLLRLIALRFISHRKN